MVAGSSARRNCSKPRATPSLSRSCRWSNNDLPRRARSVQEPQGGGMEQLEAGAADEKPLWRRIVDFPLVAMLIGIAVIVFGIFVAGAIAGHVLPDLPGFTTNMKFDLVCAPLLIILYKLIIRHLGEHKRDDLRLGGSLRPLGAGLGLGLALFAAVVAVAAVVGAYRVTGEGELSGLPGALLGPAIFAAIAEEMLFRGVLFRWIEEFGGSWAALVITAAIFGAIHLAN